DDGTNSVLLNNFDSPGRFLAPRRIMPAGCTPTCITTADFDTNGRPDLADIASIEATKLGLRVTYNRCIDWGSGTGDVPPAGAADKGDMNTDVNWNGCDIQRFTTTMILSPDVSAIDYCRADMNGDGQLNPADRDCLVLILLGLHDPHDPCPAGPFCAVAVEPN